jgi:hypothetical protein
MFGTWLMIQVWCMVDALVYGMVHGWMHVQVLVHVDALVDDDTGLVVDAWYRLVLG